LLPHEDALSPALEAQVVYEGRPRKGISLRGSTQFLRTKRFNRDQPLDLVALADSSVTENEKFFINIELVRRPTLATSSWAHRRSAG
jgi:hypothetical protein